MKNLSRVILVTIGLIFISGSICLGRSVPDWTLISGNQYNMIAYGHIHLDGADLSAGGYVLYSFGPGGEGDCRSKSEVGPDGAYYVTILGNTAGEIIRFKVYDINNGKIYDLEDTIIFEIDDTKKDFDIR